MRKFNFSQTKFQEKDFPRLVAAMRDAIEKFDYDSQWIAAPASGSVNHQINQLPTEARGMESDTPTGDTWTHLTITAVTATQITFTATKAYVRIVAER